MRWIVIILLSFAVVCAAISAYAQTEGPARTEQKTENNLYQWTDDKGVVHMTDRLELIPEKYKRSVVIIRQRAGTGEGETGEAPAIEPTIPPAMPDSNDDAAKASWQTRMREARSRAEAAESWYHSVEKKRKDFQEKWGYGLYGYPEEQADELKDLDRELDSAKQAWDKARHEVEVEIPEEARKAGVPPGWLRE